MKAAGADKVKKVSVTKLRELRPEYHLSQLKGGVRGKYGSLARPYPTSNPSHLV